MITIEGKKYIESQYIKVFPCAYRGYFNAETGETLVFDPEARATTESNFTNTFQKVSTNKDSYIVSWDTNQQILKCVIGGYYFEIYNYSIEDFFYETQDTKQPYYLCIQTSSIDLGTAEPDVSDVRTTKVLSSFDTTNNYLDVKQGNSYAFTGLLLSQTAVGTANLLPFISKTNFTEALIASDATDADKAAQLQLYYFTQANNEPIKVTSLNALAPKGTQLYNKTYTYEINKTELPITSILDVGTGNYSIRMLEGPLEQGTSNTVASGDYSIALGKATEAAGEGSVALGVSTEASALGAVAGGLNSKAIAEGAVALGSNTSATGEGAFTAGNTTTANQTGAVALGTSTIAAAANQVVIGKYNKVDPNQAFIIANGTDAGQATANKFTVSATGDVKALGTLEVKGSIKATEITNNSLELGTTTAGSSGSIKVYGTGSSEVFTVTDTGNTTITGLTNVSKDTQSNSPTSGALKVAGGVGISKNLNVGGNITIGGSTLLGDNATDTLVVAGQTTLNNGLLVKANAATSTILETDLSVDKDATLKKDLTVNGNLTLAANTATEATPITNTLTLGNNTPNVSGALDIFGASDSKVFTVDNTGKVTAAGDINVAGKVTSQTTDSTDSNTTLVTKSYVDAIYNQTKSDLSSSIQSLVPDTATATDEGTGKYVQSVEQTNGKITTTEASFAKSLYGTDTTNAPTSSAVSSFVHSNIATIWTTKSVKKTSSKTTLYSLQALVLDAVYPKGSIYMQYLASTEAEPQGCPLAATLPNSKWELIEGGRFLMSVGACKWGDAIPRGQKGGSPHAVLIGHSHTYSSKNLTGGEHQHIVAFKAAKLGTSEWTGFEGNRGDGHNGYVIENTLTRDMYDSIKNTDGTLNIDDKKDNNTFNQLANNSECFGEHTHILPGITKTGNRYDFNNGALVVDTEADGTKQNLPPYIAVYMWRRTE